MRDAEEEEQPGDRKGDADPACLGHARPECGERDQRREDDVQAGDEACARDRRQLEAGGLEPVRERKEETHTQAGQHAGARSLAQGSPGEREQHGARDEEPRCEEGEQRERLERLLDWDERVSPDSGDEDQGDRRR